MFIMPDHEWRSVAVLESPHIFTKMRRPSPLTTKPPNRWGRSLGWLLSLAVMAGAGTAYGSDTPTDLPASSTPKGQNVDSLLPDPVESTTAADKTDGLFKGFIVGDPDTVNWLRIGARVQPRFVFERLSTNASDSAFLIARSRVLIEGGIFLPGLHYFMQADFGKGFAVLKDAYFEQRLYSGSGSGGLSVMAGQLKRPFGRQFLTSDSRQLLVDRALPVGRFLGKRDIGLMLHHGFDQASWWELDLGIFNGHDAGNPKFDPGRGRFSNIPMDVKPAIVGRTSFTIGHINPYDDSAMAGSPTGLSMGVSVGALLDNDGGHDGSVQGTADVIFKSDRFAAAAAIFVAGVQDGPSFSSQLLDQVGGYIQAGQAFLTRSTLIVEPVARYSFLDVMVEDGVVHEVSAGLNLYFLGHSFKLQSDVSGFPEPAKDDSRGVELRVRIQGQVTF